MSVSSWHLPTAIATRPQLGSAPCTAVLTSGELTTALATRFAWARRGRRRRRPRSASWPPRRRGRSAWPATRPPARGRPRRSAASTGPAAPLARTTAVSTGRRVGVDADAVERAVDDTAEQPPRSTSASMSASVTRKASIVAMSGSIIPTPLATPTTGRRPTRMRHLGHGVGGHHGPRHRRQVDRAIGGQGIAASAARRRSIG